MSGFMVMQRIVFFKKNTAKIGLPGRLDGFLPRAHSILSAAIKRGMLMPNSLHESYTKISWCITILRIKIAIWGYLPCSDKPMCLYACLYQCIYIYVCVCIMCIYIYTYMHIYIYMYCIYIYVYLYIHIHYS